MNSKFYKVNSRLLNVINNFFIKVVWLLNIVMRGDSYSASGGNDKKTNK